MAKANAAKANVAKANVTTAATLGLQATRCLQALVSGPLTRKQLTSATGQRKGWSSLLGAMATGVAPHTLLGQGLVTSSQHIPYVYTITPKGCAAIGVNTKAKSKVAKASK